jgi:hypothetical protein
MDPSVTALLAAQHSVVARRQLVAAGVALGVIDRLVASGRFVTVRRGVYRLAGAAQTWEQALTAAWLAAGETAAVSHRSAAALWELVPGHGEVEITVPQDHGRIIRGVEVHRSPLRSNEVSVIHSLRVTKPARTLIDLSALVDPDVLGDALDEALSRRLLSCSYVRLRLGSVGRQGRKGVRALVAALDERADGKPLATSPFERRLFRFLGAHGLPRPVSQVRSACSVRTAALHRLRVPRGEAWAGGQQLSAPRGQEGLVTRQHAQC